MWSNEWTKRGCFRQIMVLQSWLTAIFFMYTELMNSDVFVVFYDMVLSNESCGGFRSHELRSSQTCKCNGGINNGWNFLTTRYNSNILFISIVPKLFSLEPILRATSVFIFLNHSPSYIVTAQYHSSHKQLLLNTTLLYNHFRFILHRIPIQETGDSALLPRLFGVTQRFSTALRFHHFGSTFSLRPHYNLNFNL